MRSKLSYANVMATIAVFVALGGSSYAAVQLANNSVRSKHVKDRSLLKRDFKRGQLPAGPKGDQGAQGIQGSQGVQGVQGIQGEQGTAGAPGSAKGYAFVSASGVLDPARRKGVNSVTRPDLGAAGSGDDNVFCFDLTFDPVVAVASAFSNNAGIISAADLGQTSSTALANCGAPTNDVVIETYGSGGAEVPVGFFVIFE